MRASSASRLSAGAGADPPEVAAVDDDAGLAAEVEVADAADAADALLVVVVLLLSVPRLVEEGAASFSRVLSCHR